MVASLGNLVHLKVWAGLGGLETPFLKEVDIGLGTRPLVILVGNDLDLLESLKCRHDCGMWTSEFYVTVLSLQRGTFGMRKRRTVYIHLHTVGLKPLLLNLRIKAIEPVSNLRSWVLVV